MNKYFFLTAALSFNLMASEPKVAQFGRVVELKGEGFISYKGKTREIKKGDTVEVGAEVVIEHHGQVTFTDNADHRFHLGNSSSAKISANSIELRAGDLWFQSLNKNDEYKVKTANAEVSYQGGEAILSYDTVKGKTQLMVINSMMKLSNLRAPELNLSVAEGHFSFIDNAYDEGAPRDPTPVGEKTYASLVAQFIGISPLDKNSVAIFKDHEHAEKTEHAKVEGARAIASVTDHVDKKLEEYKDSLLNKKDSRKLVTNTVAKVKIKKVSSAAPGSKSLVHIYGQTSAPTVALDSVEAPNKLGATKARAPASVIELDVPTEVSPVNPYSNDYKNQYKESDKLINDLKKL